MDDTAVVWTVSIRKTKKTQWAWCAERECAGVTGMKEVKGEVTKTKAFDEALSHVLMTEIRIENNVG